ncbi:MAG: LemA family protein [Phycisphaerales bacterium]|jgi:LemA protein|nr:LemA family protein [Phycisphaerales bacterium]
MGGAVLLVVGAAVGLLVLVAIIVVVLYNGLVSKRVDTDNAWSQIGVQLERRHDLIPNVVETVKGYAAHEKGTFDAVIQARAKAMSVPSNAGNAGELSRAEGELTQAMGRLFALAEAYPELKANTNFLSLQEELSGTENKIGFARQHFNDTVGRYEEARQSFPGNIVAGMFGFKKREFYEVEGKNVREAPKVSFG